MTYSELTRILSEHLRRQPWLGPENIYSLEASVSHWLQSRDVHLPMFSDRMRSECERIFTDVIDSDDKLANGNLAYPPPETFGFTFIDLFAGIGGFRIAFQEAGGKCVFSSEWDRYAQKTYQENFGEFPYGDIRLIAKEEIPDHDILCAGFPCQPFSLAGVSKKNSLGRWIRVGGNIRKNRAPGSRRESRDRRAKRREIVGASVQRTRCFDPRPPRPLRSANSGC